MGRFFEGGQWHDTSHYIDGPPVEWTLNVHATCVSCGEEGRVTVLSDDIKRYIYENELVQNVWPDLSTDEREILISWRNKKANPNWNYHVCPKCSQWQEE